MSLLNFNLNNKSWKMYTNTITSIANDNLLIKPNNTNDLILEVSANNNIFFKKGDISYSINTKIGSIDTSFSNVYTTFNAITSSFSDVNTKFLLIEASFNSKLASISGNIVPLNDICYNLGLSGKRWANAYIRDVSVTNISASGNIVPLLNLSGSLGSNTRIWANAFIKDISGLVNINGQPYVSGTGTIDLTNVTTNINPSITDTGSLGISGRSWRNAFIQDLSVGSIDVSVNLNPLNTSNSSLGVILKPWANAYIRDLSVNSLIPYNDINSNLGSVSKPWNKANIYDLSVTNINGQYIVLTNVSTNINPSINNTRSLGIAGKSWRNAYIGDISVNSIDVSANLNPLNSKNSSLGASNKLWGNAYIRDVSVGSMDVITNLNPLKYQDISASGGNTITVSGEYVYHIFTSIGSSTFTPKFNGLVDVFLVGGGGGGGPTIGGGGGGGGIIWIPGLPVFAQTNYPINVGAGGITNTNGTPTTGFGATAAGGGKGGSPSPTGDGSNGGSGGGASANNSTTTTANTGGISSGNNLGGNIGTMYGFKGGEVLLYNTGTTTRAAGGGGAGGPGTDTNPNYTSPTTQTGNSSGGVGLLSDIYYGIEYYWGGGGGGAGYATTSGQGQGQGGWGGLGGGGGGAVYAGNAAPGGGQALTSGSNGGQGNSSSGGAGGANTGGGGGGGGFGTVVIGQGGAGGSGIVIIRYLRPTISTNTSLGRISRYWGNAYILDLSVSSIDVSANLTPLISSGSNLGTSLKPWGNANIINLSATSINTVTNLSPATTNTGNLGTSDKIWGNSYIEQLVLQYQSTGSVQQDTGGIALFVYNPSTATNNNSIIQIRNENGTSSRVALSLDNGNYGWQISIRQGAGTNRTLYFNSQANGLNATTHLTVDGAGTNRLTYQGSVYASTTLLTSDDRLKHNETIINNGLTIIDQLVPKFYQKTLDMLDAHYYGDLSGYTWSYEAGLIAQEVLQINDISYVVFDGDYYDENNNFIKRKYGLSYNHVFVYGLAATKELHTKVKYHESSILNMQSRIVNLESSILNQQTIINSLISRIEALKNKAS